MSPRPSEFGAALPGTFGTAVASTLTGSAHSAAPTTSEPAAIDSRVQLLFSPMRSNMRPPFLLRVVSHHREDRQRKDALFSRGEADVIIRRALA
jgi:hypothetical protein